MATKIHLLTTRQAGEVLGFSDRTVARWCRDGKFGKGARKVGRVWRISTEAVLKYES